MARIRKDKGVAGKRNPATTAIPVLRTLFDHMDEHKLPYYVIGHNEDVVRWRKGSRGMSLWSLITIAEALDFDIVAVPRGQGRTLAAPQPVDRTPSAEGMVPATCAGVGLAA